jgi:hypothetical protein
MSGANQLLELSMGIEDFSSEWLHCDRISSYVARMVSHNRADSLLYANLLSSALNELLETVFAHHGPKGRLSCRVKRAGASDIIELSLPCDDKAMKFYTRRQTCWAAEMWRTVTTPRCSHRASRIRISGFSKSLWTTAPRSASHPRARA